MGFIRRQSEKRGLPEKMISTIGQIAAAAPDASLRTAMRLIDQAEIALNKPVLH
jgi:hypothetical protein